MTGNAVATSADGRTWVICNSGDLFGQGAQIYISTNFGNDWVSTNIPGKTWYSAASSADGCQLLAGENGHGIWVYGIAPSPRMNLTAPGNQLVLSWLVASTNLVLQQTTNLTANNWVTVTNVPALNLTNLNSEITLPPPANAGFFRLSASP